MIHGPLGFFAPHETRSYTAEEILEWMPEFGLEKVEFDHKIEVCLHSPHGILRRTENISSMVFKRASETKQPSAYKGLPDYLLNLNTPVGPLEEFVGFPRL